MIHICDTGPLVAYFVGNDPHHDWAVSALQQAPSPMRVCEAVLTEAAYFLREEGLEAESLFAAIERGGLLLDFDARTHWPRLRTLMARYPRMDFADACIVTMTEQHRMCRVLTLDRRDFLTYRRNDRQAIDFAAPPV